MLDRRLHNPQNTRFKKIDHLECLIFIYLFVCLCVWCAQATVEVRGHFIGIKTTNHMNPTNGTQILRLGTKCLYLLSHLNGLALNF